MQTCSQTLRFRTGTLLKNAAKKPTRMRHAGEGGGGLTKAFTRAHTAQISIYHCSFGPTEIPVEIPIGIHVSRGGKEHCSAGIPCKGTYV
jgi:hypothetical protein